MAIKRITIGVPAQVASRIEEAAGDVPVSTWVKDVVVGSLEEVELEREWQSFYRAVHPSRGDTKRAEAIHGRLIRGRVGRSLPRTAGGLKRP